jgi:hypothetical protein
MTNPANIDPGTHGPLLTLDLGAWSFVGHWSLVIGHFFDREGAFTLTGYAGAT